MAAKKAVKKALAPAVAAMPYTGNSDAEGKTAAHPAARKLMSILTNNGFSNLGIYANRPMRGSTRLSVHATGRALDAGYKQSRQPAITAFCDWLADNHRELLIEEIHQYTWEGSSYGRGFRCNRNGKPGWLEWTAENNGGPGGFWLHIEVAPNQTPEGLVRAWKKIQHSRPPLP